MILKTEQNKNKSLVTDFQNLLDPNNVKNCLKNDNSSIKEAQMEEIFNSSDSENFT